MKFLFASTLSPMEWMALEWKDATCVLWAENLELNVYLDVDLIYIALLLSSFLSICPSGSSHLIFPKTISNQEYTKVNQEMFLKKISSRKSFCPSLRTRDKARP